MFRVSEFGRNAVFDIVYFNVFYTLIVLILPLLLLVGFNAQLVRKLQASKRHMIELSGSNNYLGLQEKNAIVVLVVIVVVLVVCHTPDRIVTVLKMMTSLPGSASGWRRRCPHPIFFASNLSNLLVVLNSSANFFIYYVFRKGFRRHLAAKADGARRRCARLFFKGCRYRRGGRCCLGFSSSSSYSSFSYCCNCSEGKTSGPGAGSITRKTSSDPARPLIGQYK